jgi:hypothetical protein
MRGRAGDAKLRLATIRLDPNSAALTPAMIDAVIDPAQRQSRSMSEWHSVRQPA